MPKTRKYAVKIKDPIAFQIERAALKMSLEATRTEGIAYDSYQAEKNEHKLRIAHSTTMSYSISSIITVIAAIEGMLNEFYLKGTDTITMRLGHNMANVTKSALSRWVDAYGENGPEMKNGLIRKTQYLLELAELPKMDPGREPLQSLKILIRLRNEIVHSYPAYRYAHSPEQKDIDPLQKALQGKFTPSLIADPTDPFLWQRCLSAGCAQWAMKTENSYRNELFNLLGIPIHSELPPYKPDLSQNH